MPLLGIIASGISGNLSAVVSTFVADGSLPITNSFNGVMKVFTEGRIYWNPGRDSTTGTAFTTYYRATNNTTWAVGPSKLDNGQSAANAYPVNNKWIKGPGEYGGGQNVVESLQYNGSWTRETSYPIFTCYMAGSALNNRAYFIGGNANGPTTNAVYSYSGSGSWQTETVFPVSGAGSTYGTATKGSRVYVVGNASDSTQVYSYSGSGSWQAETSVPTGYGQQTAVYNQISDRIFIWHTNDNGGAGGTYPGIYSYTGAGSWRLEANQPSVSNAASWRYAHSFGDTIWAMGGNYNRQSSQVFKMTVR
jgi:hypothetical protein